MGLSPAQFKKRIEKIKASVDIRDVIESTGARPVHVNDAKGEYQYHAPYREDTKPSLTIYTHGQSFNDFGMTGAHGDVIQLARLILGQGDANSVQFFEAVKWVERQSSGMAIAPKAITQPQRQKKPSRGPSEPGRFAFVKATPVSAKTHPNNRDYIHNTRKIGLEVASRHLSIITYKDNEAAFDDPLRGLRYGIGGSNDSGGVEVRAPSQNSNFKMVLGRKDVTTIDGRPSAIVGYVFEGRFDFLTYLEIAALVQPENPTIILNSGGMAIRAAEVIKSRPDLNQIKTWWVWQQNDNEGDRSTQAFISELNKDASDYRVYTVNPWYEGYKDLNKFWTDAPADKVAKLKAAINGSVQKTYNASASAEARRTYNERLKSTTPKLI